MNVSVDTNKSLALPNNDTPTFIPYHFAPTAAPCSYGEPNGPEEGDGETDEGRDDEGEEETLTLDAMVKKMSD